MKQINIQYHLKLMLVAMIILSIKPGCAPEELRFETPIGVLPGTVLERFDVLGVSIDRTWEFTGINTMGAGSEEMITIDVPVGTEIIIPAVQGWRLQYGHSEETLEEHHYGIGIINFRVGDIQLPDLGRTPPSQTATLYFSHALSDTNAGHPWRGQINYSLIFLRRAERPVVPAPEEELDHYKIVGYNKAFPRSGMLADGRRTYREESTLRIPASAEIVIPSQEGWILGFGRHEGPLGPAVHAPSIPDDQHFGISEVTARVERLAPSGVSGWIDATVVTSHLLRNRVPDDPWFGASDIGFISFAREPRLGKPSTEGLEIIGIAHLRTGTSELPGAEALFQETVDVTVPAETVDIIPLPRAWVLGYGYIFLDYEGGWITWRREDHHYGVGQVSVVVERIDRSATGSLATAKIRVTLGLRDKDARDSWCGFVEYSLIFLSMRGS